MTGYNDAVGFAKGTIRVPHASIVMPQTCQNSGCEHHAIPSHVTVKGTRLRLCSTCAGYARRHDKLRPLAMIIRARENKERRKAKGSHCHNENCRTTNLHGGGHAKHNGEYYCKPCLKYANAHGGEDRPKEVVNALKRSALKTSGECENPNCKQAAPKLRGWKIEGRRMALCVTCYNYAWTHKQLRSAVLVNKAVQMKRRRLEDGGAETCENSNCGVHTDKLLSFLTVSGSAVRLCHACYFYANRTKRMRPLEVVQRREEVVKRRQLELAQSNSIRGKTTDADDSVLFNFELEFGVPGEDLPTELEMDYPWRLNPGAEDFTHGQE